MAFHLQSTLGLLLLFVISRIGDCKATLKLFGRIKLLEICEATLPPLSRWLVTTRSSDALYRSTARAYTTRNKACLILEAG